MWLGEEDGDGDDGKTGNNIQAMGRAQEMDVDLFVTRLHNIIYTLELQAEPCDELTSRWFVTDLPCRYW